MNMTFTMIPMILTLYLLLPTGVLSLAEYFLSRLESPWPGRVLPMLSAANSLCISALLLFNLMASSLPQALLIPLGSLLVLNIPTAVFLLVYRITRRSHAERRSMDRRDIQDL